MPRNVWHKIQELLKPLKKVPFVRILCELQARWYCLLESNVGYRSARGGRLILSFGKIAQYPHIVLGGLFNP